MKPEKKILLVNLPFEKIYEKTNMKGIAPFSPPLGFACIGGSLLKEGYNVKILDLNLKENNERKFISILKKFKPDFLGISFVTPLIEEADNIAKIAKKIDKKIIIIGGGPHCSSFPESTLKETSLDIVVIGEGDFAILDIVGGKPLNKIKGIGYKELEKIKINPGRELLKNLDVLPFPAYELYDIKKYHAPKAIAKKNPVGWLETSRGCVYGCTYCNKSVFGRNFRVKSPKRVVEEFIKMKELGFKQIYISDDSFTTIIERVKKICNLLIKKKVNMVWSTLTGIRVDGVDFELLKLMKKAGCYCVYFGIESGNQKILDNINKGIRLEQVRKAVRLAKKAGLEVAGYFMIGLPGETKQTMQDTIDFAISLNLDLAKIAITIPLPATPLFNELNKQGLIKTRDWTKFKFYTPPSSIYDHPNLSWKVIEKYYNKFYREFYLRPYFILKRINKMIKNKSFIDDFKSFLSIRWFDLKIYDS